MVQTPNNINKGVPPPPYPARWRGPDPESEIGWLMRRGPNKWEWGPEKDPNDVIKNIKVRCYDVQELHVRPSSEQKQLLLLSTDTTQNLGDSFT
ncbi:uncharacterized protein G2W53_030217 [Senna tora]|uniref:Uncharacterized protein n=1 Tax=Senna tora TaxID=362788 RepID=A0A834T551_9FABA|nr:uncharacterized protein G2W53_030217 [Senna tora]